MTTKPKTAPELRFPGFDGDWWKKPLQDLTEKSVTYGIVQTGESILGGVKCVRVVDLTKPKIIISELITTTEEISRSYRRTILVEGEIMIALRGEIGLLALVPKSLEGSNLTRGIARVAPKGSVVDSVFMVWALRSDDGKMEFLKQVNGSALKEIPINGLNKIQVQLTTLPEQQKIAEFLTAVDGRIGQLSQKKALLEDYKKGVMQQLFTQALRFKDDHGNDFPGWEEQTVDEVAQCLDNLRRPVNGAEREKMKGDIPYYGANGIQGYVNDFIFDENLTLLAEDGGNFDKFATRPIAQRICGKAWVNNHAHILRAKRKMMTPDFLFYSLVHKDIRQYINGSSRAKLNKGDMLTIEMLVPSVPEQTKIANFLTALDRKIESVSSQIRHTQAFKKGLLQQMFV